MTVFIYSDERKLWQFKMLALYSTLIMGVLVSWSSQGEKHVGGFCLVDALLGIPCIGCGITRALVELLNGDLAKSIQQHHFGPVVAAILLANFLYFLLSAITLKPLVSQWKSELKITNSLNITLALLLITEWFYRIIFIF